MMQYIVIICLFVVVYGKVNTLSSSSRVAVIDDRQKQVINFFAGGLAGTVSSLVTAPLEVIKTQLQTSNRLESKGLIDVCSKIWKANGINGFYRGIKPMLFGIIPTRAIYFWSYTTTKTALNSTLGSSPLTHLLSAFSAGITSNTITNPIWLVKTRFQLEQKTYAEIIKTVYKEDGIKGFFKGITASYIGCFEGAIQWIVYEKLKKSLELSQSGKKKDITPAEYARASSAAKFVAILATYPHEVVRTRLRQQGSKYTGFVNALKVIAKEEGVKGLYGGLGLHLVRSVPNAAIMFVTFELVSTYLQKKIDNDEPLFSIQSKKL